jgi:hypothetical protein
VTDDQGTEYELRLDDKESRTPLLASNGALHPALLDHLPSDRLVLSRDRDGEDVSDADTESEADEREEQPQEQD